MKRIKLGRYTLLNGCRAEQSGLKCMKTRSERPGLCLLIEQLEVESYLDALLERKNSHYFQFFNLFPRKSSKN